MKSVTAMGAEPVVLDLLNREAVMKAVVAARPDAVVHQATSLGRAGLDRAPARWRGDLFVHDQDPRLLEYASETRVEVAAAIRELAPGVSVWIGIGPLRDSEQSFPDDGGKTSELN